MVHDARRGRRPAAETLDSQMHLDCKWNRNSPRASRTGRVTAVAAAGPALVSRPTAPARLDVPAAVEDVAVPARPRSTTKENGGGRADPRRTPLENPVSCTAAGSRASLAPSPRRRSFHRRWGRSNRRAPACRSRDRCPAGSGTSALEARAVAVGGSAGRRRGRCGRRGRRWWWRAHVHDRVEHVVGLVGLRESVDVVDVGDHGVLTGPAGRPRESLRALLDRVKASACRASPVRRVDIPRDRQSDAAAWFDRVTSTCRLSSSGQPRRRKTKSEKIVIESS